MLLKKLHHVAYRCNDAQETVDFYTKVLGLTYAAAVHEDFVESAGESCEFFHVFFQMEDGSYIAFFELPEARPMGRDANTPGWVQHLALEVGSEQEFADGMRRLKAAGISFAGPVVRETGKSVYFADPNGHRLEFVLRTEQPGVREAQHDKAVPMLEAWKRKWHAKEPASAE